MQLERLHPSATKIQPEATHLDQGISDTGGEDGKHQLTEGFQPVTPVTLDPGLDNAPLRAASSRPEEDQSAPVGPAQTDAAPPTREPRRAEAAAASRPVTRLPRDPPQPDPRGEVGGAHSQWGPENR